MIKHVTLQKIVAHDFRYDPRIYTAGHKNCLLAELTFFSRLTDLWTGERWFHRHLSAAIYPTLCINPPALVEWEVQLIQINEDDRMSWVVNLIIPTEGCDR